MDPRTTPCNGEVAAIELRGRVDAARFVEGDLMQVAVPVLDLYCSIKANRLDRQLLRGDGFRVLQRKNGLAFGQADRGDYVGYVLEECLTGWQEPTHWVSARASLEFSQPDFKSPGPIPVSHGSKVRVIGEAGDFSTLSTGGFVPSAHLRSFDDPARDPVAEAEKFLGAPYLWGGNASFGLDCSGLVQGALTVCAIHCPGDSDLQEQAFADATGPYRRGDLLFWKGHVAMVVDDDRLIHANAHHMAVAFENIAEAISRIELQGDGAVTSHKRPVV